MLTINERRFVPSISEDFVCVWLGVLWLSVRVFRRVSSRTTFHTISKQCVGLLRGRCRQSCCVSVFSFADDVCMLEIHQGLCIKKKLNRPALEQCLRPTNCLAGWFTPSKWYSSWTKSMPGCDTSTRSTSHQLWLVCDLLDSCITQQFQQTLVRYAFLRRSELDARIITDQSCASTVVFRTLPGTLWL